jgi:CheY-like chemotaxis protein
MSHKILIVEDFEPFRRFVSLALQERGAFQVFQASDGLEGVQKAEELQPDLILFDIGLPKLNGLEAAKRARKRSPRAKLLFVSQESSCDVIQETFRLGAQGYVHKPSALNDLLPAVDAALGSRQFLSGGLAFNERPDGQVCHRHEILFYSDEAMLLDGFARFITTALNAGDVAIGVLTESHQTGVLRRLHAEGVDTPVATEEGRCTFLSITEALSRVMIDDWPDPVLFANLVDDLVESAVQAAEGRDCRVAACGASAPTLWATGKVDAAIQLERLWNRIGRNHRVDLLCGYPLHHLQEEEQAFKRLCAEHTAVYCQ